MIDSMTTGTLVLAFSLFLIGTTSYALVRTAVLLRTGTRVAGTVVDRRMEKRGNENHYFPRLRFTTRTDREIIAESQVSTTKPRKYTAGSNVMVIYDPSEPTEARIAGRGGNDALMEILVFGLGVWLMFYAIDGIRALNDEKPTFNPYSGYPSSRT